jgi:hypothetical protein
MTDLPKTYPTREAAARAWLDAAKRQGKVVTLGGGWWVVHYVPPPPGNPVKKRLQGLVALYHWLTQRGILRALPDGTVERLS